MILATRRMGDTGDEMAKQNSPGALALGSSTKDST